MIKKLILSLLIIIGAGVSGVLATQALLSDQVTLTANAFSTGSVDLQIKVGDAAYADTQAGFTETMLPGETESKFFKLKNNNSGTALAIAAQATLDADNNIPTDKVTISFTPWTSGTSGGSPEVGAVTTTHTLAEWIANPYDLGIPDIGSGNVQDYKMDVSINSDVTTSNADSKFSFTFTGEQVLP